MNKYEITLRGRRIQVQASCGRIALNRAFQRLTDSDFLNTSITVKFLGRVDRRTLEWIDKPAYTEGRQ